MKTRTRQAAIAVAVFASSFAAAAPAHAYERIKPSEVTKLTGRKVWVEVPCEVHSRKPYKEVHLVTGQELTLKGRERNQIDAWCVVQDDQGNTLEVMVKNLSAAKPKYSMLATGKIDEFLPKVFAEAYDLPLQLADLWKAHDYCLDKDDDARDARECLEEAAAWHKLLLGKLVRGGNVSKATVLSNESYRWLWTADPSVMDAFCDGILSVEAWKKTDFRKKAEEADEVLGTTESVAEAAGDTMMVKDELKRKPWMSDLRKDVPLAQRDALDKDETSKREARVRELEARMTDGRARAEKERATLGY
jgi:hypothetical protein